jgi:2-succinyl-6-hydroxy-2,4-cyclohexadiene-1-carboxylate synthase
MMFSSQVMVAGIAHDEDWFHLLLSIKCPVLLIRAKGGEGISDEDFIKMQSLIPDCVAYEMSNTNHNVHLGNKEEFYECFDEFFKKYKLF